MSKVLEFKRPEKPKGLQFEYSCACGCTKFAITYFEKVDGIYCECLECGEYHDQQTVFGALKS